jgi:hypothetical protein
MADTIYRGSADSATGSRKRWRPSAFCLTVGLGTWLVDATTLRLWFPLRAAWIGLNLVLAIAAIPRWLRPRRKPAQEPVAWAK